MGSKFRSNYRFIENLIDEFNKKAGLKISKNAILNKLNAGAIYVDGIEPNEPKVKDDEYKHKYARYENLCINSYQTSFRELYENYVQRMDKKIRSGKEPINEETKERNNKDLKEVTGLFFSILYTTYLKHFNDEGMLKAAKAQAHNITVDSYGKYNQFDGEQFSLANNNLYNNDKERIKASNDMINLFSNYVDYKAEKINSGQWHANSLKQSLDNTAIDPNATREDIQKYIHNYRALEEKHKNRSFF